MIVKRTPGVVDDIEIYLECLNPNYASAARLSYAVFSLKKLAKKNEGLIACEDGACSWLLPNGSYNLLLSAAATLIPDAEEGDVHFQLQVWHNEELIPPYANSSNPEEKRASGFYSDPTIKTSTFNIAIL